jgi:Xaa-Pro dipeptidase
MSDALPPPSDRQPASDRGRRQSASDLGRRDLLELGLGGLAGVALGCRATTATPAPISTRVAGDSGTATAAPRDPRDEVFADLLDQSSSVDPIDDSERAGRRRRLGEILAARDLDAMLIEPGATMSYLADVSWGQSERLFALCVLADGSHFWVCPAFEEQRAQLSIRRPSSVPHEGPLPDEGAEADILTWEEHEYAFAPLAHALRERRVERLCIEPSVRYRFADGMARELGAERVVIGTDAVVELRGRKDTHELAILRRANELTQRAIGAVAESLEPGLSERDISARLHRAQQRLGLSGMWSLALIGASAAYPHGDGRNATLERGSLLLVDTGGSLHGYASDISRTWIFSGTPSAEVDKAWNAVRDAQRAAYETIRPGIPCKRVDEVARGWIEARGYGSGYRHFTHRLGHGIGMQGHEDPYFDGGSEVILAEGMTFSDEPGIYVYGEYGVRLEDIVAVTETAADHFGEWQASPLFPV